jgi:hypothetical protein
VREFSRVQESNERENMSKEKRSDFAIFTLAGSILFSSILISMNPSNAHTTDSRKIKTLEYKVKNLENYVSELEDCVDAGFDRLRRNSIPNNCAIVRFN